MKAFPLPEKGTMMIHHPPSTRTLLPLFASTLSHNLSRSFASASPAHDMGLKFCKNTSSGRGPGGNFNKTSSSVKHTTPNAYNQRTQERVLEEEAPRISETTPPLKISQGQAFPIGVSEAENGINFAIFSQHATAVTLCLSLPKREKLEGQDGGMIELPLDPCVNRTGDIWHICIEDLPRSKVLYGYRIDGPRDWHQGHRFDSSIVLIDPYAKLVDGRRHFGDASAKLSKFLGTYDFDSLSFDWGDNYELPNIPEKDLVIYEMNVRAFTVDESSGLDPEIRGSYLGVIEKFGSRIARESNRKNFGSNHAANQASAGSVVIRKHNLT